MAVAGVTAAQKIGNFMTCPYEALGATMAAFAGQNMGAGKTNRIKEGLKDSILCGFAVSALLFLLVLTIGKQLPLLFLDAPDAEVIGYAYRFMLVSASGYTLVTLVNAVRFTIQGMGFSGFAIIAGVMEMIARLFAGLVLIRWFGFNAVCMAHVLAWVFADLFLVPAFFHCIHKTEKRQS